MESEREALLRTLAICRAERVSREILQHGLGAIDEDWSALRFRHVDNIKTMKRDRSRAMFRQGKKRTARR